MNADHTATAARSDRGTLYVVATPIGNRADFSPRARDLLGRVDLIAAEDTRMTRRLVDDGAGLPRLISLNEHNENDVQERILARLEAGADVALVSDAGTPLISDPGYRLVAAAHEAGYTVSPVPGPCAAIAALSAAGLASDHFYFEGFLPARSAARRRRARDLADRPETLIFYVPARDLVEALDDLIAALGPERLATLARELSKIHETVRRAALAELRALVASDPDQRRGEAVVLVAGQPRPEPEIRVDALIDALTPELPPSRAAKILARVSGLTRQQAWSRIQARQPGARALRCHCG
ncbi:MAG: 16S rRNA (cytidine(1402)-2'-O)-methyltransferase, partial [Wenzhouxiangella sp.]|nr:16S rRNA (cytidine(1402)-2'-O)-methyltransferase [Wenzhouxiangella sp.]